MKHHLTFKKRNSNQFWQIEVSGNSFTVPMEKLVLGSNTD
ncbi:hypothetical protein LEP1GSC046_3208 [Leptospira kirschneri serovar Bim str. 1051]|nr:hypothetical protein LEP1GSC042_3113 [Leptospira kirschneri serovar Bim str. PUO 1247]EMN03421.1 hypothetical protein LEP1GSC046_3208 [Leptospira kirschneri serovar Bim str. 1051]